MRPSFCDVPHLRDINCKHGPVLLHAVRSGGRRAVWTSLAFVQIHDAADQYLHDPNINLHAVRPCCMLCRVE